MQQTTKLHKLIQTLKTTKTNNLISNSDENAHKTNEKNLQAKILNKTRTPESRSAGRYAHSSRHS